MATEARDGALSLSFAARRDAVDALAAFRARFYVPEHTIYLDGNSLGLLSRDAESTLLHALDTWKRLGVDGWTTSDPPWFFLGEQLGAMQADLVGARPSEVVTTGAITQNLHALLATFYRPTGRRTKIVCDALDFPSDVYALASWLRVRGLDPADHLVRVPSRDGRTIDENDVIAAMTADVALVWLPSVLYRSGQLLDMPRLTREAHARDLLIGFDLAHSAGSVPHSLHEWGVDFGVWCTYKYLNAGPGAVGALFVHERHHGTRPALAGWWGSDKERQFDLDLDFTPTPSAGAFQISTPSVLGAATLYGSLEVIADAGINAIRAKSLALTEYLMSLADAYLTPLGIAVGTPRLPACRGGHVALEHPDAMRIARALHSRGVVPDFRPPDVIRLAPIALYTSFSDVWRAVQIIHEVVARADYAADTSARSVVT